VLLGFSAVRNNESIDGQIRSFKRFQKQSKKYKRFNKGIQKSAIFFTLNCIYQINDEKQSKNIYKRLKGRFDENHLI
jgi:ribosomal protein S21